VVQISVDNNTQAGGGEPRRIQSLATGQQAPDLRRALATNITGMAQPAVAITSDKATLKAGETATITFTFSRDPGRSFLWNGTRGDVRVEGGTLSALRASADPQIFTATFTPMRGRSGVGRIAVPQGSYSDALGNAGDGGLAPPISCDTSAPTLATDSPVQNGALLPRSSRSLSLTFSEPIQLAAAAEAVFQVLDGSGVAIPFQLGSIGADGRQVTLDLMTPPAQGPCRLVLASALIRDSFGNAMGSEPLTIAFRVTAYDAVLTGTTADETLTTGAGNDLIRGRGGRDTMSGGAGNDRLLGGNGNEVIDGGPGDDVLDVATGGGHAKGGPGNDTLRAVLNGATDSSYVILDGGMGNDRLSASGAHMGTVWLKGGGGGDALIGSDGADLLRDDDDAFTEARFNPLNGHWYQLLRTPMTWEEAKAVAAASRLGGRQGYLATITSAEEQAILRTIFEDQFIRTTTLEDQSAWIGASDAEEEGHWRWVTGPEAGSLFHVRGQSDQPGYANWAPGQPDDSFDADAALWTNPQYGNAYWQDFPIDIDWNNVLIEYGGTPGDGTGPVIQAGDTLLGGAGDDNIDSWGDNDQIDGGAGLDMLFLDVSYLTENLALSLVDPSVPQRLPAGGSVVNVERLSLRSGSGDDTLAGGSHVAFFHGGSGRDRITLGSGGGSAFGEEGNDVLIAVLSDSTRSDQLYLDGGSGDDRLSVTGKQAGPVRLVGGGGVDALTGSDGDDVLEDSDPDLSTVRFNPDNGHWYQLLPEATGNMGWEAALATAAASQLWGRQGYLVTITSAEEEAFLTQTFGWKPVWLGASDAAEEGTWRWVTGPGAGSVLDVQGQDTQPGYANWAPGEPNNMGAEDFACFTTENFWNDISINDPFPPMLATRYVLLEYGGIETDDDGAPVDKADTLSGGEGNDTMTSGGATDHIDGGGGQDHLSLNLGAVTADVTLSLAEPSRPQPLPDGGFVVNVESVELRGGRGNDSIVGGSGRNTLRGGAGDDLLDLGSGGGWASGEAGDDHLLGGTVSAELYGDAGDDWLELGAGGGWASGGAGQDQLRLGSGGGQASGDAGADELVAVLGEGDAAASLTLHGGSGDDRLSVSGLTSGGVNLSGGGGIDSISGSDGQDHLQDNDSSYEEPRFNPLNGHWYRVVYSEMTWADAQATAAASRLSGRQGYLVTVTSAEEEAFLADTFGLWNFWLGASDAEEEGTWRWLGGPEAGEVFDVPGQESQPGYTHWASGEPNNYGDEDVAHIFVKDNLWLLGAGSENYRWNDVAAVNTNRFVLIEYGGTPGDSTQPVVPPGDTLLGGAGDDIITSAGDSDRIDGGAGNDQLNLDLTKSTAAVRLSLANPSRRQSLPGGGSVLHVERIDFKGGSGNDSVVGGRRDDNLSGGMGDDLIDGGLGKDVLFGDAGVDVFRFSTPPDWWTNLDTVGDFSPEAGEKIHLARSAFSGLGPIGSLAKQRFAIGAIATTTAQRIVYNSVTGDLLYDPDGSAPRAPVPFATLSADLPLTASQFVVV
jgi:Ca2+-binding RTX toxin-like protein